MIEHEALIAEFRQRLTLAVLTWGAYASAHEALGVLLEEVRELEDEVFKKQGARDLDRMRSEGIDIAVVGLKIALMVDAGKGRA